MNGAVFYAAKYGSTAQYARWISEATGLPIFDMNKVRADPSGYDLVVIGAPVIYHKLMIRKWVNQHLAYLETKPIVVCTVSGATAGAYRSQLGCQRLYQPNCENPTWTNTKDGRHARTGLPQLPLAHSSS